MDTSGDQFATVPTALMSDTTISLHAKGMYAYLATLDDGADIGHHALADRLPEGKTWIAKALNELRAAGWYVRDRQHVHGRYRWTWTLNDRPIPPGETATGRAA